jgi:hypothetical protein
MTIARRTDDQVSEVVGDNLINNSSTTTPQCGGDGGEGGAKRERK